jgi:hypothetical protein
LDLNGREGIFIAFTNGLSNGTTNAPLSIQSAITNDGGNGVTIGGLVVNGGVVQNTGNQMVATAAARHRALRSLPIVTGNCDSRDDEDKEAGSRVKH